MCDVTNFYSEYGGKTGSYFKRNIFIPLNSEKLEEKEKNFIKSCNNIDAYKCVYLYEDKEDIQKCKLYAPFYLDFDGDLASDFDTLRHEVNLVIEKLKQLGLKDEDIQIYFSGCKGFHLLIDAEVLEISPNERLNEIYKAWAVYFYHTLKAKSLDLGIYDRRRLLRINGTINSKTGLYKIYLPMQFFRKCTQRELYIRASSPLAKTKKPVKRGKNEKASIAFKESYKKVEDSLKVKLHKHIDIPKEKQEFLPCIKELIRMSADKGMRNNTLTVLASGVLQSGYNYEETLELMLNWNQNNNPPMNESEVIHTVKSAYAMLLSGRHYGCSSFRELGVCLKNCKLYKKN